MAVIADFEPYDNLLTNKSATVNVKRAPFMSMFNERLLLLEFHYDKESMLYGEIYAGR